MSVKRDSQKVEIKKFDIVACGDKNDIYLGIVVRETRVMVHFLVLHRADYIGSKTPMWQSSGRPEAMLVIKEEGLSEENRERAKKLKQYIIDNNL